MTEQEKQDAIMDFLHARVFDPVLRSSNASHSLKSGVRTTIHRMRKLTSENMIQYFWSAIAGKGNSVEFERKMKSERFDSFEDVKDEFGDNFSDYLTN